jgi:hypothetical protein
MYILQMETNGVTVIFMYILQIETNGVTVISSEN